MSRSVLVFLLVALFGWAAFASDPPPDLDKPLSPSDRAAVEAAIADELIERHFDFETESFWLNLHHLLMQQAALDPSVTFRGSKLPPHLPRVDTSGWSEEHAAAWGKAIRYYLQKMFRRNVLFDNGMIEIKERLKGLGENELPSADDAGFNEELVAALSAGSDAYRARLWEDHKALNRAFVEELRPRMRKVVSTLPQKLTASLGMPWPEPIRVDVCIAASWAGAYTTLDPHHICVASIDSRSEGWLGVEVLFHEAGHTLIRRVWIGLQDECQKQGKELPRDLWHTIIFFTAGELVRPYAGESFVPYAAAEGLWDRAPQWADHRKALQKTWPPLLEGKVDVETAIAALVKELP